MALARFFFIYHVTDLTFGRGGYVALMLLCGLTVKSGIYVLAAFRDNARCCSVRRLSGIEQYLKAFNQKFSAISLTLLSTILGLVPFLFSQSNDFWFSFAVGVMGGLVTSFCVCLRNSPSVMNWCRLKNFSNLEPSINPILCAIVFNGKNRPKKVCLDKWQSI